jgi:hypothetical protein
MVEIVLHVYKFMCVHVCKLFGKKPITTTTKITTVTS